MPGVIFFVGGNTTTSGPIPFAHQGLPCKISWLVLVVDDPAFPLGALVDPPELQLQSPTTNEPVTANGSITALPSFGPRMLRDRHQGLGTERHLGFRQYGCWPLYLGRYDAGRCHNEGKASHEQAAGLGLRQSVHCRAG